MSKTPRSKHRTERAGSHDAPTRADRVAHLLQEWRRERPDLDVAPMAIVGRILNLGWRLEARANRVLKPFGISYTDLDVLATLRRTGAPYCLTPTALCGAVLVTSGAMTACLDRLERAGFVMRQSSTADRRSRAVALTTTGRRLVDEVIVVRFAEAGEAISSLSVSERRILAKLLARLGETLESEDDQVLESQKQSTHKH
jgi:DNA-binding MarR family transcriptional regulator